MTSLAPIWTPHIQQSIYRALLEAMSYPASTQNLESLIDRDHAALAVLATLTDNTVSLSDPDGILTQRKWSMLQVPKAETDQADFVLMDGSLRHQDPPPLNCGDIYYPERSATLILKVESLVESELELECRGPGIENMSTLKIAGLSESWLEHREEWNQHYPIGVDLILCSADMIAALPRTTQIKVKVSV